jgi:hypothetical protein
MKQRPRRNHTPAFKRKCFDSPTPGHRFKKTPTKAVQKWARRHMGWHKDRGWLVGDVTRMRVTKMLQSARFPCRVKVVSGLHYSWVLNFGLNSEARERS